jgi:hypothetical protein
VASHTFNARVIRSLKRGINLSGAGVERLLAKLSFSDTVPDEETL